MVTSFVRWKKKKDKIILNKGISEAKSHKDQTAKWRQKQLNPERFPAEANLEV